MQFNRVTASKYIGPAGYSLQQRSNGQFSIYKDGSLAKWGPSFRSVRAAENFLNLHNYLEASADYLPVCLDDIKTACQFYQLDSNDDCTEFSRDGITVIVDNTGQCLDVHLIDSSSPASKPILIRTADDLFKSLDSFFTEDDIFSSVILRGIEFRSIFAAKNRRSSRDIVRDLIRVKSSNVWAYGVEVKENNPKLGDVYVQFKGKNGGPDDVYKLYDVPLSLWRKWISAPSKGHFYNKYLKHNFYYSKLTGDKRGKLKNAVN